MTNKSTIPTIQQQMDFDEEWRDVPGYEEFYEISNKGRVRTKKERLRGYPVGTLLIQASSVEGYRGVTLIKDGESRRIYVHRLVMLTFVGEPGDLEVNHKDGVKWNNVLENLEYVTHQENITHAHDVLNAAFGVRGVKNGRTKLTVEQVHEIRRRIAAGETSKAIAKDYPVSDAVIGQIRRNEIWKTV